MKNLVLVFIAAIMISSCVTENKAITQLVKFSVKPEYLQEFREAQVNSLNHSLEEEGNLEMKLYANDKIPSVFYVFSKWKNSAAYELHKELPHSKALVPLFKKALAQAPEIIIFEDTNPKHIDSKALISTGNEQALFIPFTVKDGYEDRIIKQFEKHTKNSRKEEGNVFFDFYKVAGQKNAFYIYENWQNSPEVLINHRNQDYMKETMALLNEAMEGTLEDAIETTSEYDENTLNETYTLEKLWEAGDVIMPESILSIPNHEFIYVSVINTYEKEGYISRYKKDGTLDTKEWVKGINIPTGSAFYKGYLYVVDVSQVHIIDIASAKIIKTISSEATSLNDISIGVDGIAYVSDLTTGSIYRLKNNTLELWLHSDKFPTANGVLIDGNHLIVGSLGDEVSPNLKPEQYGSLFKVNLLDKAVNIITSSVKMGVIDGVVKFKKGMIVSDPINGKIYYIDAYKKQLIYDVAGSNADIGIDNEAQVLYVPNLFHNKIAAYKIVKK